MVVAAILIGAVATEFSGTYRSMQIASAAGRLGDMMAFCYGAAATQLANYRLHVDPETGRAWVAREMIDEETGAREYQVVSAPGVSSFMLPEAVVFDAQDMESLLNRAESGEYYIQFRRDGTADFTRLRLLAERAAPMDVNLNGLTGRVTVREAPPEELEAEGE